MWFATFSTGQGLDNFLTTLDLPSESPLVSFEQPLTLVALFLQGAQADHFTQTARRSAAVLAGPLMVGKSAGDLSDVRSLNAKTVYHVHHGERSSNAG